MADFTRPPKVFISYAWEDDVKTWARELATRLRLNGINAILDQWETVPGDQLPEFMEKSVRESDFVVFICTPRYKKKSDQRKGGVGYEGHIITGEIFSKNNHRKFIPVLRKGKWTSAAPSWATSKLFIDLRGNPYNDENYHKLLSTLHGELPFVPAIHDGKVPAVGMGNGKLEPALLASSSTARDHTIGIRSRFLDALDSIRFSSKSNEVLRLLGVLYVKAQFFWHLFREIQSLSVKTNCLILWALLKPLMNFIMLHMALNSQTTYQLRLH